MLELYHDWDSFCSLKVRLCLAEKRLAWTGRRVDLMKFEHLSPEYLKLNPNGVVPTLVDDGAPIVESTVINEYLDEVFPDPPLKPGDPRARARMRAWVKYEDDVLHPSIRPATFQLMIRSAIAGLAERDLDALLARHPRPDRVANWRQWARAPVDAATVEAAKRAVAAAIDRMDRALAEAPYLAGDSFSLADVAAAPFIDRLEHLRFAGLWEGRKGFAAWALRVKARPAYREALAPDALRLPAPAAP